MVCEQVSCIKNIVGSFNGKGKIVTAARESINQENIELRLTILSSCYLPILDLLDELESKKLDIKHGYDKINKLYLGKDPANVKEYIKRRLEKNQISKIIKICNGNEICPTLRAKLWNCQCTSVDVERSFSFLWRMLKKERGFNAKNVKSYMICSYNSKIEYFSIISLLIFFINKIYLNL